MISSLLHLDDTLFIIINSHHARILDSFFYLATWLGNGWVITPMLVALAWIKVPKTRLWLFILISATGMVASGLINSKIKDVAQRPRPVVYFSAVRPDSCAAPGVNAFTVHTVGPLLSYRSFPSGHSNTAFSAATLVALTFGGWYWLAFVVAAMVGYSRIYIGAHFPLDVIAGGLLGSAMMVLAVIIYKRITSKPFRRNNDTE